MAAYISKIALSAQVVINNLLWLLFSIAYGISMAASALVG
jgi:Na+-driven multidrug efflux pump